MDAHSLLALCVALGAGLLIGAERERRKVEGPDRSPAGIRTFAVASLVGAVAMLLGGAMLLAVAATLTGAFTLVAFRRAPKADPGMTTEMALLLTCLIGGLAVRDATLAGALGVTLAGLLAVRERIHHFVRSVLSEQELHDALLLAAAAIIAVPLAPDRYLGPFDAINPRALVTIVVLVMTIGALGHIALRLLGARFGLPLAGLISGFISSSATILANGRRSREQPQWLAGLTAGAVLSSLSTVLQLALLVAVLAPALLAKLALPLASAGVVAAAYAAAFTWRALHAGEDTAPVEGRAFELSAAVLYAALIGAVLTLTAALNAWTGERGALITAAISGLADAHAAAVAAASLLTAGKISAALAVSSVLAGFSANTLVKAVLAFVSGGRPYAMRVVPGLALMLVAAWVGATW